MRGAEGDEAISYYHSDHLGSSNVMTDETGNKVASYEYQPYGQVSKTTGTDLTPYKFTGKELDSTGLYYYGARYYDAEIGRFISADTIVQHPYDPQDLNRYAYCRNNPINYIDPTGHGWFKKIWKKITGAFVGGLIAGILTGGYGFTLMAAGFWGGAVGGAVTGGLEGGWQGALIGAGTGGALGFAAGGIVNSFGFIGGVGLLAAGAAYAGATGGWEGVGTFAAGALAGMGGYAAGRGLGKSQQFQNWKAGKGFVRNGIEKEADGIPRKALVADKGKTVSDRSSRESQVKDVVASYKKYGSGQIKKEIQLFESMGGKVKYNGSYEGTGQFLSNSSNTSDFSIEFGTGNWDDPWAGYAPGREGLERTFPHEIYHFMHDDPYVVEEPVARNYANQQREILKQNRGW